MLRQAAISVLVVCTFTGPAAAESVGPHGQHESRLPATSDFATFDALLLDSHLEVLGSSLQALLIDANPSDWRESRGADVWRLSFEDLTWQVQVFPTFHSRGAGEPQCCFNFTVGDTEFWVKPRGAGNRGAPNNDHTSEVSDELSQASDRIDGPAVGATDPASAGAPSSSPASGAEHRAGADNSTTQLPEPGSIFLMGLGVAAASRRIRDRRVRKAS